MLRAIHQLMPNENLIYVADNKFTPYGERSAEFIEQRTLQIAEFLMGHNVKALVVACNTATAAGVHSLRDKYTVPIIGLEPALKPAVEFTANEKVGVLATQATLDSEKYQNLRARFLSHTDIIEKASHFFVELVERSQPITELEFEKIQHELNPFVEAKVDSLVLGCTHYPFLTEAIQSIMGPDVTLFESGMPVAREVKRRLEGQLSIAKIESWMRFYSSAPKNSIPVFNQILGREVKLEPFGQ